MEQNTIQNFVDTYCMYSTVSQARKKSAFHMSFIISYISEGLYGVHHDFVCGF